jgi:hypothetical protein
MIPVAWRSLKFAITIVIGAATTGITSTTAADTASGITIGIIMAGTTISTGGTRTTTSSQPDPVLEKARSRPEARERPQPSSRVATAAFFFPPWLAKIRP